MKKINDKLPIIFYCIAVLEYIVSIIEFINGSDGIIFLCLATSMLCIGTALKNKK